MGQVLHGSATTTEAVRRAIQDSQESLRSLARRYGINPKTVAKWKKRSRLTICQRARENRGQRFSRLKTKRSSLPSGGTPCCRSMTASTPYSRRSHV